MAPQSAKKEKEMARKNSAAVSDLRRLLLYASGPILALSVLSGVYNLVRPAPKEPSATVKGLTHTVELTDANFDAFMADHPEGVLVDFNLPNCKFCTRLAPQFDLAARRLKDSNNLAPLAVVDVDASPEMAKRFDLERYPSVFWFWHGRKMQELERAAEKTATKIQQFVESSQEPALVNFGDRSTLDGALPTFRTTMHATASIMICGFAATSSLEKMVEILEPVAQFYRGKVIFMIAEDKETADQGYIGFKSIEQEEDLDANFDGAMTEAGIADWVTKLVRAARLKTLEAQAAEAEKLKAELEKKLEEKKEQELQEKEEKKEAEEKDEEEVEV